MTANEPKMIGAVLDVEGLTARILGDDEIDEMLAKNASDQSGGSWDDQEDENPT